MRNSIRKPIFLLALLLAFSLFQWQEATARCCPPPPATTGTPRYIDHSRKSNFPPTTFGTFSTTGNISGPILSGQTPHKVRSGPAPDMGKFLWDHWWAANNSELLVSYEALKPGEGGIEELTLDLADVPRLVALLGYRGMFEDDAARIALENLMRIPGADDVVAAIANGSFQYAETDLHLAGLNMRALALQALGSFKGESVETTLLMAFGENWGADERFRACLSLRRLGGQKAVDALVKAALADPDPTVRAAACFGIAMLGGPEAEVLLEKLVSSVSGETLPYALLAYGYLASSGPEHAVMAALNSSDGVRIAAAFALAQWIAGRSEPGKEVRLRAEHLFAALRSEKDPETGAAMSLSLLLLDSPEFLDGISSMLMHPLPGVRAMAALALAMSRDRSFATTIAQLAPDPNETVETARATALAMLASQDFGKLAGDLIASGDDVLGAAGVIIACHRLDGIDEAALAGLIGEGHGQLMSKAAAYSLAVCHRAAGAELTRQLLQEGDSRLYPLAIIGTACHSDSEALDTLNALFREAPAEARTFIEMAMELMDGLQYVPLIAKHIESESAAVRSAAALALGSLGRPDQLHTLLGRIISETDPLAQAHAIAALNGLRIPEANEPGVADILTRLFNSNSQPIPEAFSALALSRLRPTEGICSALTSALHSRRLAGMAFASLALAGKGQYDAVFSTSRPWWSVTGGETVFEAGYVAVGLQRQPRLVGRMRRDINEADFPIEYLEPMAFAVGRSSPPELWETNLDFAIRFGQSKRENLVKMFVVMEGLDEAARREICARLSQVNRRELNSPRFFTGLARYSLGDRAGLRQMLDAAGSLPANTMLPDAARARVLQKLVNSRYPLFYRVPALAVTAPVQ